MSGLKARLNWRWLIALSLVAGFLLRVLLVQDMEFKEDEEYHFYQTQLAALGLPWPWVGIASGVYILNPGMSVWVFNALSGAFHLHTPTALCLGVRLFAFAGVAMILPFVRRAIPEKERAPWFWAMALAMVNPFLILYERKLWPEPFLPAFTLLTLLGWFRRRDFAWAFVWGLIGACLGQIHMSGFFFALALAGWTLLFSREKVNWKGWLLGSVLGALPLFPWLAASLGHPSSGTVGAGLSELLQFKFWAFWITDPLGLTLGNPLGIARGNSVLVQIADFLRYPLIGGTPTYLVCVAHLAALASGAWILARGTRTLWRKRREWRNIVIGRDSSTAFVQNAALLGFGLLMTTTTIVIRRYYLCVAFPLELVWLARMAGAGSVDQKAARRANLALGVLWCCQLLISSAFLGYVHTHDGAPEGDYGAAYHVIIDRRLRDPKSAEPYGFYGSEGRPSFMIPPAWR